MANRKRVGYFAKYALFTLCPIVGFGPRCDAQSVADPSPDAVNKAAPLRFEIASVRLAPDLATVVSAMRPGVPPHLGTKIDGDRVDMGSASLMSMFCQAYSVVVCPDRVSGPDWMATQRFDILAKMPAGATKDKLPEMLQALLEERFGLRFHRVDKPESGLALFIGPKGHKLEPAIPDAAPGSDEKATSPDRTQSDVPLSGIVRNGPYGTQRMTLSNGVFHVEFYNISAKGLAEYFRGPLRRPVTDMTGLRGTYHVLLDIDQSDMVATSGNSAASTGDRNGDPSVTADAPLAWVFAAIDKLGLKLEPRKVSVEQFVIDHIEKLPTEN